MKHPICKNAHEPGCPQCLGTADLRYTMDFSDIGKPPLYWCSVCGPVEHEMKKLIESALDTRPGFAEELEKAIDEIEPTVH